ncbi:sulfurtransferase [Tenacibaculum sp. M341]|uniref:sulfurtransferase n=1 Tax=Tenacibaculum sp. M341 TaxID=2530339 RepID=UPI001051BC7B|nr:sulfurtransferase [Tenacibaculum sp. M341]TCI92745.1 sulfurtransferase [Tenacibaculum sp. M341]
MLTLPTPLVSVNWLKENKTSEKLIVLDATIPKVVGGGNISEKRQIPNAIFFDLKKVFLDKTGEFPNTIPSAKYFEEQVQKLGIHQDSCIVVYDDLGIYSSARVWWLFTIFGFKNIAVLDGGLPAWELAKLPTEKPKEINRLAGNFKAVYNAAKFTDVQNVLNNIALETFCVADARSEGRFYAKVKEPREGVRGGHIPKSISLPYADLQNDGFMKSKDELATIFQKINSNNKPYIFSCGTGITACILALGLEITGNSNYAVYDGSWTEWGSLTELPIEQ